MRRNRNRNRNLNRSAAAIIETLGNPMNDTLNIAWEPSMNEWSRRDVEEIIRAAHRSTTIHLLSVDFSDMNENATFIVASIIQNLGHIKDFQIFSLNDNLNNSLAYKTQVDMLLEALIYGSSSSSSLTAFTTNCSGGPQTIIQFAKRFPLIEVFELKESCLLSQDFSRAVAKSLHTLIALQEVTVACYRFDHSFELVLSALKSLPLLEYVEIPIDRVIQDTRLLLEEAAHLCSVSKTIKSFVVNVESHSKLSVSKFLSFPGAFSSSLIYLSFTNCVFPPGIEGLYDAAEKLRGVKTLMLTDCDFAGSAEGEGNKLFCLLLERMTRLTRLEAIGEVLVKSNSDLERLAAAVSRQENLQRLRLDLPGSQSFPAIIGLLRHCRGTLRLFLGNLSRINVNYIGQGIESLSRDLRALQLSMVKWEDGAVACTRILRSLKGNTTLEWLGIVFSAYPRFLNIEACCASMYDLLLNNKALKDLNVGDFDANDYLVVLEHLVAALKVNRTLMIVRVHQKFITSIPPAILPSLLEMLQANTVLHTLGGVRRATTPSEKEKEVEFFLKLNRYGRRFLVSDTVPLGFWPVVLENVAANTSAHDVMFHFLKTRPSLFCYKTVSLGNGPELTRDNDVDREWKIVGPKRRRKAK